MSLLTLPALAWAQSAPPSDGDWYSDPALTTRLDRRVVVSGRTRGFPGAFFPNRRQSRVRSTLYVHLKNTSTVPSTGAHRLRVRSYLPILNGQSEGTYGSFTVPVCGDAPTCTLAPGASIKVPLQFRYRGYFTNLLLRYFAPRAIGQNQPFTLQLLHNADMDGTSGALENAQPFSALVNAFRASYPDNTVLLSSGDNYIPGPRFSAASDDSLANLLGVPGEGRADIAMMNAMGYQASAIGNHDLDTNPLGFLSIIDQEEGDGQSYPGARFPYLSANLDFSPIPEFADAIGQDGALALDLENKVAASAVLDVAGQRIGVVGATTPSLANITSTGDIAISPENAEDLDALAAKIQLSVDALRAQGINKVILLAHMQTISIEKALAERLEGVDIIVAGGSNTLLADSSDILRDGDAAQDRYPLEYNSPSGEPVLVVNTDGDYKYLGRLVCAFDLSGKLLLDRLSEQVNGAYASTPEVLAALGDPAPNPEVVAISSALSGILAARDGNILGKTSVYLDGRRGTVRNQESNLGNLSADANLWLAQQYDSSVSVALKNGGGIRDDIGYFAFPPGSTNASELEFFPPAPNPAAGKAAGEISQFDVQGALRFNNGLTLLTVSGTQLAAIVEHGIANATGSATSGRFPQVAGLRFEYNPNSAQPDQDANGSLQFLAATDASGQEVVLVDQGARTSSAASTTFRVVTLDFLYNNCGDGYPLPGCNNEQIPFEPGVDANVVYLEEQSLPSGANNGATFADAGSEQDALAEYLLQFHSQTPYDRAETPASEDTRIRRVDPGPQTP